MYDVIYVQFLIFSHTTFVKYSTQQLPVIIIEGICLAYIDAKRIVCCKSVIGSLKSQVFVHSNGLFPAFTMFTDSDTSVLTT